MLTPRQVTCLDFIVGWFDTHKEAPAFNDIMAGMGVTSKSSVHRLLVSLEDRGYIRRLPHRARALEILRRLGTDDAVTAERERVLKAVESHLLAVSSGTFTEVTLDCVRRSLAAVP